MHDPATAPGTTTSGAPSDADLTLLERELALLLRRAHGFSSRLARDLHPDLEAPAYSLLVWLDDLDQARLTDIAAAFGVGKGTLSRQLHLLQRLGLITREPDPRDGRSALLSLTPDGRAQVHTVRQMRQQRFRQLLAGWPEPDIATLAALLCRFNGLVAKLPDQLPDQQPDPLPDQQL